LQMDELADFVNTSVVHFCSAYGMLSLLWFIYTPKLHVFGLEKPCRLVFCLLRPGPGI